MPLLMITGYPSSGKTTIAKQLVEAFEAKIAEAPKYANLKVELVNDERLGIAKGNVPRGALRKVHARVTNVVGKKAH